MATILLSAILVNTPMSFLMTAALYAGASYIDNKLFGPEGMTFEGQRMKDLSIQASAYGVPIPKVYGRFRTSGNVIWGTNFVEHRKEETSGGGKGGGGGETTTVTYTYSTSFAIGLHDGKIDDVVRAWADGKEFPLYEVKYSYKSNGWAGDPQLGWLMFLFAGLYKDSLSFSNVSTMSSNAVFNLTVKTVNGVQVLGVKGSDGTLYDDAKFGEPYLNSLVSFTVNKKQALPNGLVYQLTVQRVKTKNWDLYYGTEDQQPDPFIQSIESGKYVPAYRGLAYIVFKDLFVTDYGNRIPNFTFEITRTVDDLENILKEISISAGLSVSGVSKDVDFAAKEFWTTKVHGMMTSADDTYRNKIEKLAVLHDFFAVETNGMIEFKYKEACNVYPVPPEFFGAKEGNKAEDKQYEVSRMHDMELPRTVTVSYLSYDKDYQSGSMDAVRPTIRNENIVKIDLDDIVLSDSIAKTLAEQKLYEAWIRRSTIKLSLPLWWAFLAPGDILACNLSGRQRTVQITKTSFMPPGVIHVEATDIGGNTYSRVERAADSEVLASPRVPPSPIMFEFLDIPLLPNDNSTAINMFCAASGNPYYGAALYETKDGGASWVLKGILDNSAKMGYTTNQLLPGITDFWDNANSLTVVLSKGTLESRPEIDVLNGYNAAVIGEEIVQFKTAELIAEQTYKLSGLLRGRLGTEDKVNTHAEVERFVLLESATLGKFSSSISDWNTERTYRFGPTTESVTDISYDEVKFTNTARAYQPWSVCNIAGSRNENGRLTITWCRRDRSGGEWLDGSDIAMTEQSEKYEIDIMSGSTVKRTLTSYVQTISYTETMQQEDFGSLQPSVTVRIYQISATRGRGIVKEATV